MAILALGFGLRLWVASQTTPTALVRHLESRLDGRVEIRETSLSVFRFPAEVRITGFKLAGRDANANRGIPLGDRKPMERWAIAVEEARLEASLWSLLTGNISIKDLRLDGLDLDCQVRRDGSWNISSIFRKPSTVNGEAAKKPDDQPGPPPEEADERDRPVLRAKDFPMATRAQSLRLSGGALRALLKKKGTYIDISGLDLAIHDLDVDPADLENHNQARFDLKGVVRITRPKDGLEYAVLHLEGSGEMTPFDAATGGLDPRGTAAVTLLDPCTINLLPSLEKIADKVRTLKKFGIDVTDEITTQVIFAPGTPLQVSFGDGRLTTTTELPSTSGRLQAMMAPGGWIEPATGQHRFDVALVASEDLSSRALDAVRDKARIIPGKRSREEFLAEIEASLFPDDRFRPLFSSKNDIGDPDVDLENPLPDMQRFLRGVLEDLGVDPSQQKQLEDVGKELLKGLLGS